MGWESVTHRDIAESIKLTHGKYLADEPKIRRRKGETHVILKLKRNTPLSKMLSAVSRFIELAEAKGEPTRVSVQIPHKNKTHVFRFEAAVKGYSNGRPKYPAFGLVRRALYIGPDFPRPGAPNIREIVGQYIGAFEASLGGQTTQRFAFTASDVGIAITRRHGSKKEIEIESDIDLFHIKRIERREGKYYELTPVEVITSSERIKHKLKSWEQVEKTLAKMARAEGTDLRTKPIIVFVDTRTQSRREIEQIERQLRRRYPEYRLIRIGAAARARGKYLATNGEYGTVEYVSGALRSIAELPEKYHSDLTSAVLKNANSKESLREIFSEITQLRRMWRDGEFPEAAKHHITDRYVEHLLVGRSEPLIRALDEGAERYREWAGIIEERKARLLHPRGEESR